MTQENPEISKARRKRAARAVARTITNQIEGRLSDTAVDVINSKMTDIEIAKAKLQILLAQTAESVVHPQ